MIFCSNSASGPVPISQQLVISYYVSAEILHIEVMATISHIVFIRLRFSVTTQLVFKEPFIDPVNIGTEIQFLIHLRVFTYHLTCFMFEVSMFTPLKIQYDNFYM